jgi:hypothetical protein
MTATSTLLSSDVFSGWTPETPAATLPAMGTKSREHLYGTSVRITHPAHIQDRMER